ncbi:MAG TPA: MaoC/PaaZ C-terminal domain-containing protein [Albitalea sp.]|uniref:MaoC/PaaZ C-terminal domain-containing protein n=1 Tax=Piscinibacter sp. TaxID=1903157 RepID=UPI002ED4EEC5
MIDPDKLLRWPLPPVTQAYTERDSALYALGLGLVRANPAPPTALRCVYEGAAGGMAVLPTLATVLATGPFWMQDPATGITWQRLLHAEQRLEIHRPLPAAATVVGEHRVDAIVDKGADKGALMLLSRRLFDQASGDLLATVGSTAFLRGDGGFGGRSDGAPPPHPVPADRPADHVVEHPTRPEQALLYRLSGDLNPLHADPAVAQAAGFAQPILHGLCSYGIAGLAVLAALCGHEPRRLKRLDLRFANPVFPGETLVTEIWRLDAGRAALRVRVPARADAKRQVVLDHGLAEFTDAA